MAGKKRKLNNEQDKVFVDLMQEVDWDDSALIDSWNKQKEEYKKYHSLHARGENVEAVLDEAEAAADEQIAADGEDAEDGEVDEQGYGAGNDDNAEHVNTQANQHPNDKHSVEPTSEHVAAHPASTGTLPTPAGIPQVGPVPQDDTIKNLVMAWYWAGYYSGLHEGQKASQATNGD